LQYAQGAAAVFIALLQEPSLSSFLVLREPDTESIDVDSLHGILHPTLAPYDPDGPPALVRATRGLNQVLPQLTFVKFSLASTPTFYQKELATELMQFFRTNNWTGSLPSVGNSSKLALLTRLAGGMGAWKGELRRGSSPNVKGEGNPTQGKLTRRYRSTYSLGASKGVTKESAKTKALKQMMKAMDDASTRPSLKSKDSNRDLRKGIKKEAKIKPKVKGTPRTTRGQEFAATPRAQNEDEARDTPRMPNEDEANATLTKSTGDEDPQPLPPPPNTISEALSSSFSHLSRTVSRLSRSLSRFSSSSLLAAAQLAAERAEEDAAETADADAAEVAELRTLLHGDSHSKVAGDRSEEDTALGLAVGGGELELSA